MSDETHVLFFEALGVADVPRVGGKNASLGEMIAELGERGIRVPGGFATTAEAYRAFLRHNGLEGPMLEELAALDEGAGVEVVGPKLRKLIEGGEWPEPIAAAITEAYRELSRRCGRESLDVAVRSSATAEDLPEASFAGQQESFLNVSGEAALLKACKRCYASLFTDRAIGYREEKGFDHMEVALSVGVQQMVRSDTGSAGVMFTIDSDNGFPDVVVIDGSWGLGESVVSGTVDPDSFQVYKPLLGKEGVAPIVQKKRGAKTTKIVYADEGSEPTRQEATSDDERAGLVLGDQEILQLARWGCVIEDHYGKPMDIEWAKDGTSGAIYIVQARPETVQSQRKEHRLKTYRLTESAKPKVSGLAIGNAIGAGKVFVLASTAEGDRFEDGGVLVAELTDPDWVPIMRRASAIVTDHGGRTSHAAIVSRELGVPAVIGTGDATQVLAEGDEVTVSCAEGEEGHVYEGFLAFASEDIDLDAVSETETQVMINLANPDTGFRWWGLPADGVGLARMEFLIGNVIKVHPMALVAFDRIEDEGDRKLIEELTRGYAERTEYFVDTLARGIAKLAASQYPDPVIVRFSDFKSNEYADLVGGRGFEPEEANPMIGFRGASRYYDERYREAFALECQALRRARESIGFDNVIAMVPFCRTPEEADRVIAVLAEAGLERGKAGFQLYVMAEIPSNIILAREFARRFDGFSIGSNDLTQLTLGVDRDSELLAHLFDERHEAVTQSIRRLIAEAHAEDTKVGLCGQAPSDYPEFAAFLVEAGIDSISVSPSSLVEVRRVVAEAEARRKG